MNCYQRDIIEKSKSPPDSRHLYCLMSGYQGDFFLHGYCSIFFRILLATLIPLADAC